MMEIIGEIFVKFGTEIVAGGVVLAVRWVEKRWMNSKFRRKLKRLQEEGK